MNDWLFAVSSVRYSSRHGADAYESADTQATALQITHTRIYHWLLFYTSVFYAFSFLS